MCVCADDDDDKSHALAGHTGTLTGGRAHAIHTGQTSALGSTGCRCSAEGVLAAIRHVQEAIVVLVVLVDGRHQRSCARSAVVSGGAEPALRGWPRQRTSGRQHVVDEDEDRLLRRELYSLPDHVDELANREVRRHQVPVGREAARQPAVAPPSASECHAPPPPPNEPQARPSPAAAALKRYRGCCCCKGAPLCE